MARAYRLRHASAPCSYSSAVDAWTSAEGNALVRFTGARVTTDYTEIRLKVSDEDFAPPPACSP